MEVTDILDSLEDLGYQGPLLEDGTLETAVTGGAESPEFTKLCAWLVSELKLYCKLEENVQATNCPSEAEGFQLEMSGLLAELCCPYPALTTGEVTKRLLNANNCVLLLSFLISELESSRMIVVNQPQKKVQETGGSKVFMELKGICMALGMSKPPSNITMFQFFSGIEKKLKEALAKVPPSHIGEPLMKKPLGPVHWEKIEAINQALENEYEVRRKMLLKRLDVTVQSFGWSERAKTHADKLSKVYQPLRVALATKTRVSVAHLFAAREDLSKILRTSSGHTREKTACAINKVLMGRVPDRGGRPNEIEPPPPEMPTWQKRQDGPQGGGGGGQYYSGGGRGGGRGGYDQQQGGRGGHDRGGGGGGRGGRGDHRGGKAQGNWQDGYQGHYQDGGYRGGYGGGGGSGGGGYHGAQQGSGYQGGGYQGVQQGPGYQGGGGGGGYQGGGGGYQHEGYYQDGGRHQERGGRGGRGGRGRGGGGGGRGTGQGGGWGGRGGQNFNQGGQFEQFFQQGGHQYSQAGFGQGRQFTS
ncbi:protein FAM98A [Danio rerio]|uniref:Family with sequence similarity 98 member A n=1 Tax=Danio rerio TaxID=7955 RepID=X1WEE6_DANRE|nr:protein FAM98A [Danio rerio]XP_021330041.1 protein FAM98A [Danio rerio]XP_684574.3 protein FAM98A [Danio rerio]|eukprot:XP_021328821.1 protein FAM98A [Danio rerio]